MRKFLIKPVYVALALMIVVLAGMFTWSASKNSKAEHAALEVEESTTSNQYSSVNAQNQATTAKALDLDGTDIPKDIKKILTRGKLVVGIFPKDAPFFMTDEKGELYGLDIDLAKDIAKNLNVGLEFNKSAASYQDLVDMLEKGQIDIVISKLSRTIDRAKTIRYTSPYVVLRQALLVNRVEAVKNNIEEYPMDYLRKAHVKIGVLAKSSYVEYVKTQFQNATVVEYSNWEDVVDALVKGELFAAMRDENEVIKLVRQNPNLAVYASVYVLKDKKDYIAMAVPYESTQLLSWLNTYIETSELNEDINSLIKKYPEVYEDKSQKKNSEK
jgi:ABC-type amino acid transport substrate-binding protein